MIWYTNTFRHDMKTEYAILWWCWCRVHNVHSQNIYRFGPYPKYALVLVKWQLTARREHWMN